MPRSPATPIPETSTTLLRDLAGGADSSRWTEFVNAYIPVLRYYLGGLRKTFPALAPALFDDIIQETLVTLVKAFPSGRYDRSRGAFHVYLSGILRNKAMHALSKRGMVLSGDRLPDLPAPKPSGDDDLRAELWRMLVDRVFRESRYSGQSKAIFLKLVSGEATVEELSRDYRLKPNAIYQLKKRVMDRLLDEGRTLAQESDDLVDLIEALARKEWKP